ncbi:MAG: hypothetical protein AB1467_01740 [Candidatus Diapherotrites archaeon]
MNKTKTIALALLVLAITVLFSCTSVTVDRGDTKPTTEKIKDACISLCNVEKAKGTDLSNGPCLGNPLSGFPDFVCDVAHDPRTAVDNLPENQCSAFREGKAKHFVEVDESCKVINEY